MLHVGCPEEVARKGVEKLVATNTVTIRDDRITLPSFIEAQECVKSDRLRAKESRERRALGKPDKTPPDKPSRTVTPESRDVTPESRNPDSRHDESRAVTGGHSLLCSATPCSALPGLGESAQARDPSGSSGGETQAFRDVFAAEAFALDWCPAPELTHSHLRTAVTRTRAFASARKIPFEQAARELSRAALQDSRTLQKDPGFTLLTAEPGKPKQARPANGNARKPLTRGTTAADFEHEEDFETQMARMRAGGMK